MAQTRGLAASGTNWRVAPWFSGVLRSISGNYLMDWTFHALCVVGLMIITLRFAPARFPQLWVKEA
jgi:MFS transporter, CP family, cyanate transporter